jgi:spore coat protein U domain-containing protein, fimbrial subunit CupE1/2/3/6
MRNVITALLTAGVLLGVAASASAGTQTANLAVSATVIKNCSAATTNAVAFGNYTPLGLGALINATGGVVIACTKSTTFTIALNGGSTTGGNIAQRLMGDGAGDTLQYNLYTTNAYATVWGDGSGTSKTVNGTGVGMGTQVTTNVFGQMVDSATNAAQPPGAYNDTVLATVTF